MNTYVLSFRITFLLLSQHCYQHPNCILVNWLLNEILVMKIGQSWHIPNSEIYFSPDGQIGGRKSTPL